MLKSTTQDLLTWKEIWGKPTFPPSVLLEDGWEYLFSDLEKMDPINGMQIITSGKELGKAFTEVSLRQDDPSGSIETILIVRKKIRVGYNNNNSDEDLDLLNSLSTLGFNEEPYSLMCNLSFRIKSFFVSGDFSDILNDLIKLESRYDIGISISELPDSLLSIRPSNVDETILNSFRLNGMNSRRTLSYRQVIDTRVFKDYAGPIAYHYKIQDELHWGFSRDAKIKSMEFLHELISSYKRH